MLVGGQKQEQECFLTELSALMTLESTTKLAEGTPLTFLGKSVELSQAEKKHQPSDSTSFLPRSFWNNMA